MIQNDRGKFQWGFGTQRATAQFQSGVSFITYQPYIHSAIHYV